MRAAALLLAFALTAIVPVGVRAEPMHDLADGGRYQLMEVNDKVVRLDTETGAFELCRMEADAWSCTVTRDQRAALEARIAELTRRIEDLEATALETNRAARVSATASPATPAPVVVEQLPLLAQAAPQSAPQTAPVTATTEFSKVADIVPPVEVGRSAGHPMVIAPAAPAPQKPGLVERLGNLLPNFGW
ncbi:hypothetical protein [Microbaculum sp. FT89]|uniref:hypothetical protein n=1 Tax=Microbaculum sp. FT89 TaxID=3447298 RepID=UPI003F53ADC5